MHAILAAEHVTKVYAAHAQKETTAVRDVSLDIREGEFVCLLGTSGCGKSTMLNLFAGFSQPTSGRVLLRGQPITKIEPRCGMVFQSYALFPWKTVRQNIEFGPKMRGAPAAEQRALADRLIAMVKLSGFEDHYPAELSGGMQQRVTLARSLAADPEVLLMDEPFAALDAMTRQVMQEELLAIKEETGKTVVFITHNIDEAIVLADRIVVMAANPGRITAVLDNPLCRPRDLAAQASPAYAELKQTIWNLVVGDVRDTMAGRIGRA